MTGTLDRIKARARAVIEGRALGDERCPGCGGNAGDSHFDRSLCRCDGTDWGTMHTYCNRCGYALDGCGFQPPLGNQSTPTSGAKAVRGDERTCYLCGALLGGAWLQLPSSREGHPVYICRVGGCAGNQSVPTRGAKP